MESIPESKVLEDNRLLHRQEAPHYDRMHPAIWNAFEQGAVQQDVTRIRSLAGRSPLRVLDVGCGTGNLALKFLAAGDRVDCVDLASEMLAELQRKQQGNVHLRLFESDADAFLKTAGRYNVICFSSVLHHLPDYNATLARCSELLEPGGVLYVTHEPLPKFERDKSAPIQNALTWMGWKAWRGWQKLARRKFPRLNYALTDVHLEAGIAPDDLLKGLSRAGLQSVMVRRYRAEPLTVVAWVNNKLAASRPQHFAFMAQKPS